MKGGRKVAKVMFNIVEFSLERFTWIYLVKKSAKTLALAFVFDPIPNKSGAG